MQGYAQKKNGIYVLSRNDIEEIAIKKLKEYAPSNLERPLPLDTTDFLENHLGLLIKYKYIGDFSSGILGLTVMGDEVPIPTYDSLFNPIISEETYGTVLITPQLLGNKNLPRRRYTEMHEACHFMLHQPYFEHSAQNMIAARTDFSRMYIACRKIELRDSVIKTDNDWLEYQADALAAAMLMPYDVFVEYVHEVFRKNGVYRKYYNISPYIEDKRIHSIIYDVAETFRVSYLAAKIRMLHLGLIRETNYRY